MSANPTSGDSSSSSSSSRSRLLQFQPLSSIVHPEFWHAFSSLKIDQLQLSDEGVPIRAFYRAGRSVVDRNATAVAVASGSGAEAGTRSISLPAAVTLDADAFHLANPGQDGLAPDENEGASSSRNSDIRVEMRGYIQNYNTVEAFKKADKGKLFDELATQILDGIATSSDPESYLNKFLVLSFADLKKYKFYHWFAFPALIVQPPWHIVDEANAGGCSNAAETLGMRAVQSIAASLPSFQNSARRDENGKGKAQHDASFSGAFLVKAVSGGDQTTGEDVVLGRVMSYEQFFADVPPEERIVAFIDPSSHAAQPGWPLRNLLLLLTVRFGVRSIKVLRWLDDASILQVSATTQGSKASKSMLGTVLRGDDALGPEQDWVKIGERTLPVLRSSTSTTTSDTPVPSATGWERNASGKLAPKVSDQGPLMDPKRLADQAVDLNLKLMRWRIMPSIQLEKVQNARCLLFGAGTLGCYVARTLMGWGVRRITFIDNATVSYSNPVRQPLFDFEDCLDGGKPKAPCAAEKLRKIYPGVHAEGHMLAVPMPGHPIPEASRLQTEKDLTQIEKLVDEHDVLFLLMDSRESRWLPSLLGAAKGKLVLNAALGFDTYLVMRHGAPPDDVASCQPTATSEIGKGRLGCYFCNDIVAPSDSLVDRTLDQMCTVTRPGIAPIAGASAVELMVSVLQHKDGIRAPASSQQPLGTQDFHSGSCLGLIPHQIRGFLAQFNNLLIIGQAYDRCTACSKRVVDEYLSQGHEMLFKAFNEEKYLEKLTGLDKMYEETDMLEADLDVDWDEED